MRIVIDTNVLLSGILWGGAPKQLIQFARDGDIEIVSSNTLLEEFKDVIQRSKFTEILRKASHDPNRIVAELRQLCDIYTSPALPEPICRDADDDAVLACAIAARANLIVSGDKDLLTLQRFQGIGIVTPREALDRISNSS